MPSALATHLVGVAGFIVDRRSSRSGTAGAATSMAGAATSMYGTETGHEVTRRGCLDGLARPVAERQGRGQVARRAERAVLDPQRALLSSFDDGSMTPVSHRRRLR